MINNKNEEIKACFKQFCAAEPDSTEKKELEQKLSLNKQKLNQFLQKEKEIKKEFSMKKFKSRDSPGPKVKSNYPAPTVTNFNRNQKKHFS